MAEPPKPGCVQPEPALPLIPSVTAPAIQEVKKVDTQTLNYGAPVFVPNQLPSIPLRTPIKSETIQSETTTTTTFASSAVMGKSHKHHSHPNPNDPTSEAYHTATNTPYMKPAAGPGSTHPPGGLRGHRVPSNNSATNVANARNPWNRNNQPKRFERSENPASKDGAKRGAFDPSSMSPLQLAYLEQQKTIAGLTERNIDLEDQINTFKVNILSALTMEPRGWSYVKGLSKEDRMKHWQAELMKHKQKGTNFYDLLWDTTESLRHPRYRREGAETPQVEEYETADAWNDAVRAYMKGLADGNQEAEQEYMRGYSKGADDECCRAKEMAEIEKTCDEKETPAETNEQLSGKKDENGQDLEGK